MRLYLGLLLGLAGASAFAQPCVFSLSPASATFTAAGGNDIISITLVSGPGTCARTAASNASWITVSFGSPGTGNGTVGYSVQANQFTVERTGTLTVAGQTFTVTQAAGTCAYSVSPSSATVAASGASGSFNLTASSNGCAWTAVSSSPDWLTVTSAANGTGSTTVRYTAVANTTTASRSATITVGTATFTVSQAGACAFTLNPASATVSPAGATGSVAVQASASSCAWTAVSNNPDWLTLTGATSGTGNGTVAYSAAAAATFQDRAGSLTIGGVGFTVLQTGSSCTFALSNNTAAFPASGGSGSFLVTSVCPWTPVASHPDWIVITSQPSTTGAGSVTFVIAGNTGTLPRTGTITVGNSSFTINQTGVPCAVNLAATSASVGAAGGTGSINVLAGDGCSWVASTTASWITLSGASGTGNGDVNYTAAANTTAQSRTAVITVANQRFTLTQDGAQCDYALTPGQATLRAEGGAGQLTVSTACSWSATTAAAWISFPSGASGTGTGTLAYSVAPNPSSDPRTSSIRVATQTFTIVQTGKDCTFAVTPATLVIAGRGGRAAAQVVGAKGCRWEPSKDQDWLAIDSWSSIDGTGSVTVSAAANPSPTQRFATLAAGGQAVQVVQGGLEVLVGSPGNVLNAASFVAGPVAPGAIVTIFGAGLGPARGATLQLAADGLRITAALEQVTVYFDESPAPLLYVSDRQISAQVPYSVAGRQTTQLIVSNQGVESSPVTLAVTPASPAIFTLDASGKGQGAVLNQDGSVNAAGNAAQRNTIIQIFATGEGQTAPEGVDGLIASGSPLPRPQLPVAVTVGGQAATVVYAGAAPGAVAGLFQVNARLAANTPLGAAVPVVVRVGTAASPAGVTVAVR